MNVDVINTIKYIVKIFALYAVPIILLIVALRQLKYNAKQNSIPNDGKKLEILTRLTSTLNDYINTIINLKGLNNLSINKNKLSNIQEELNHQLKNEIELLFNTNVFNSYNDFINLINNILNQIYLVLGEVVRDDIEMVTLSDKDIIPQKISSVSDSKNQEFDKKRDELLKLMKKQIKLK